MQKYICLKGVRNDTVRFIVMGDWGGLPDFPYRTPVEKAVGDEMGKIADYLDIQFVLALGDNFYFDGIKDVDDPRFKVINKLQTSFWIEHKFDVNWCACVYVFVYFQGNIWRCVHLQGFDAQLVPSCW